MNISWRAGHSEKYVRHYTVKTRRLDTFFNQRNGREFCSCYFIFWLFVLLGTEKRSGVAWSPFFDDSHVVLTACVDEFVASGFFWARWFFSSCRKIVKVSLLLNLIAQNGKLREFVLARLAVWWDERKFRRETTCEFSGRIFRELSPEGKKQDPALSLASSGCLATKVKEFN